MEVTHSPTECVKDLNKRREKIIFESFMTTFESFMTTFESFMTTFESNVFLEASEAEVITLLPS